MEQKTTDKKNQQISELEGIDIKTIPNFITKSNPIVIECGANIGQTTECFLKLFPEITIYCFEPDPRCIKIFLQKFDNDNRSHLCPCAISNKDGVTMLHQCSGKKPNNPEIEHISASSIKEVGRHSFLYPWVHFKTEVVVPTLKLDTWNKQMNLDHIDFMWVDVEGAEGELILGATNLLKKTKYFYTEYSNIGSFGGQINLKEMTKLLYYFEIVHLYKYNVLFRNKLI